MGGNKFSTIRRPPIGLSLMTLVEHFSLYLALVHSSVHRGHKFDLKGPVLCGVVGEEEKSNVCIINAHQLIRHEICVPTARSLIAQLCELRAENF